MAGVHKSGLSGATRDVSQYDLTVDVGVQRKLDGAAEVDGQVESLGTLVDQSADHLRRRLLTSSPGVAGLPGAAWVSTANDPVYAPEHLIGQRVFTSVFSVTYRAMK